MGTANVCPVVRVKAWHPSQGAYVEINASDFDPIRHERFELAALPPLPVVPPTPSTPAPPPSPLANLPRNWRDQKTNWLRETAEKVSGRTPETREQAVQMIDAALAK
jgi:hypothetical protein